MKKAKVLENPPTRTGAVRYLRLSRDVKRAFLEAYRTESQFYLSLGDENAAAASARKSQLYGNGLVLLDVLLKELDP